MPLIYGLLIEKSSNDYDDFFDRILEHDDYNPDSILTDFELGTIKSISVNRPNVNHQGESINKAERERERNYHLISNLGCLFLFGQCVWRKIQHYGLQTKISRGQAISFERKISSRFSLCTCFRCDRRIQPDCREIR